MARYRIRKADDGDDIYHVRPEGVWLYLIPLPIIILILIPFWIQAEIELARKEKFAEQLEIASAIRNSDSVINQGKSTQHLDFEALIECIAGLQESGLTRMEIEEAVTNQNKVFHSQCQ